MRLLLHPANFANFLAQASEIASEICSHLFRMAFQKSDLASTLQPFFPALFRAELQGFLQGFFPPSAHAGLDKLAIRSSGSAEAASWREDRNCPGCRVSAPGVTIALCGRVCCETAAALQHGC
jgi:hypothetical protein